MIGRRLVANNTRVYWRRNGLVWWVMQILQMREGDLAWTSLTLRLRGFNRRVRLLQGPADKTSLRLVRAQVLSDRQF